MWANASQIQSRLNIAIYCDKLAKLLGGETHTVNEPHSCCPNTTTLRSGMDCGQGDGISHVLLNEILLGEEDQIVVWCNICNIKCESVSRSSLPSHDTILGSWCQVFLNINKVFHNLHSYYINGKLSGFKKEHSPQPQCITTFL